MLNTRCTVKAYAAGHCLKLEHALSGVYPDRAVSGVHAGHAVSGFCAEHADHKLCTQDIEMMGEFGYLIKSKAAVCFFEDWTLGTTTWR